MAHGDDLAAAPAAQLLDVKLVGPAGGGRLCRLRIKAPCDEQAVRLIPRVDPVPHLSVEVDEVLRCDRAELGEVEVHVAPDQGVGRPLHRGDAARQTPAPLVLLQLEAEPARFAVWQHAKDVGVHVQPCGWSAAQPTHEATDEPPLRIRSRDVVARMRQRLEEVRAYRRLARPTPHDREQVGQLSQVVELGELPYLGAHARPRRRPVTSVAPWTTTATKIADAKETTRPSGNRRARTRKNEANANNPSSRPPRTLTAASGPWIRCAKPARTDPYSGNGASSPASLAPSTGATAVSRITKPVATTIRAGMSHRGNTTGAADRVLCSGIKKSETTSTKMTTTKEARAGRKKEAQHNRHCGIGRGRHAEAPGPSLALCRPRISQAKRRLRHRARHDARRRAGGKLGPGLSARKNAIGPDVNGIPINQPPTEEPHLRPARLAAPTSSGVSTSFRARAPAGFKAEGAWSRCRRRAAPCAPLRRPGRRPWCRRVRRWCRSRRSGQGSALAARQGSGRAPLRPGSAARGCRRAA